MKEETCIFCKIVAGDIPSEMVYEDDWFKVILDLGPASTGHMLILPKEHFADVCELEEPYSSKLLPLAARLGRAAVKSLGCAGFNLVQNNGEAAGQTVRHFHLHVIPRYENGPKMVIWEPGNPEKEQLAETAEKIRKEL